VLVRGDAALTARLLLRGTGLAGLLATVGGGLVIGGALAPWRLTVAQVTMLGHDEERVVAATRGLPGTVGGWVVAVAAVAIVVLGLLVAVDQPPRGARWWVVGLGLGCFLVAVGTLMSPPPTEGLDAAQVLASLGAEEATLPAGIEVVPGVRRGYGPGLVVLGALLAILGGLAAREA
jgi:hypothetical protein